MTRSMTRLPRSMPSSPLVSPILHFLQPPMAIPASVEILQLGPRRLPRPPHLATIIGRVMDVDVDVAPTRTTVVAPLLRMLPLAGHQASTHGLAWSNPGRCHSVQLVLACLVLVLALHPSMSTSPVRVVRICMTSLPHQLLPPRMSRITKLSSP